jgi:hypothetical protein
LTRNITQIWPVKAGESHRIDSLTAIGVPPLWAPNPGVPREQTGRNEFRSTMHLSGRLRRPMRKSPGDFCS